MIVDAKGLILYKYQLFSLPIPYSENITLHPVKMEDVVEFQLFIESLTVRKESKFPVKEIIKMSYLDFLYHCALHPEYEIRYKIPNLSNFYIYAGNLLSLVCKDQDVKIDTKRAMYYVNGEEINSQKFEEIREIILAQNGVDFDVNEFMNKDTEEALKKAQEFENKKNNEKSSLEDYIDSVVIGLETTEDYIRNLSIRKFWRLFYRINKHEEYSICKTAEVGGMVSFKTSIPHWTGSLDIDDKYAKLKTDEQELRSKIG
jgi:hypothetical protein